MRFIPRTTLVVFFPTSLTVPSLASTTTETCSPWSSPTGLSVPLTPLTCKGNRLARTAKSGVNCRVSNADDVFPREPNDLSGEGMSYDLQTLIVLCVMFFGMFTLTCLATRCLGEASLIPFDLMDDSSTSLPPFRNSLQP